MSDSTEAERLRALRVEQAAELRAEAADLYARARALEARAAVIEGAWEMPADSLTNALRGWTTNSGSSGQV